MNKKHQKTDKFSYTILAAFILMSGAHFTYRYNIGPLIDAFFHPVSAEQFMTDAAAPAPLSAAPVMVPAYTEGAKVAGALEQRSIARNPFAAPAIVRDIPVSHLPASTNNNTGTVNGLKNYTAAKSSPILRGIVHSGNKSLAIIEYQGTSRAYSIGQDVGNSTLEKIGNNFISIAGEDIRIGGKG